MLHKKYNLIIENTVITAKQGHNSQSTIIITKVESQVQSYIINIHDGVFCPHNLMQRMECFVSLCNRPSINYNTRTLTPVGQ